DPGVNDFDRESIDWLTDRALEAIGREEAVGPAALTLLLRQYADTERADLSDAIGAGLARALDGGRRAPSQSLADWLMMFTEAAAVSDDARIREMVADLVSSLRQSWDHA